MRRPRELGIVAGLLLGLSGCAGLPGQANYRAAADRSSVFDRGDGPLSRMASFWRRPAAEVLEDEVPAGASARPASVGSAPLVVRNEPGEGTEASTARPRLFRHFPRLSRLWNHAGAGRSQLSEGRESSSLAGTATASMDRAASPSRKAASIASAPALASRRAGPARSSAPSRDLAFDWPDRNNRPQVDPATVPARNSNPDAGPLAPRPEARLIARSPQDAPSAQPGALPNLPPPDDLPVPSLPTARPAAPAPTPAPTPAPATAPAPAREVPQPTLPKETQPVPSSSPAGEPAPSVVSEPEGEETAAPRAQSQAPSGQVWSTWPSSPMPVEQHEVLPSAQSYLPTAGCVDSCGPKCKIRHKICPLKKHKYVDSCDGPAPVKVKKPCFLKRWLHKKSCTGGDCGCVVATGGCGSHAPIAIASPQEVIAPAASGQW